MVLSSQNLAQLRTAMRRLAENIERKSKYQGEMSKAFPRLHL